MKKNSSAEALSRAKAFAMVRRGALLGRALAAPMEVGLILTYACNYDCLFCALQSEGRVGKAAMPLDAGRKIIDDLARCGVAQVSFTGGGDPLCHPRIDELVAHALDKGLAVSVCTNGSLLKDDQVERWAKAGVHLSVSFNAADEATYRKIHGGAQKNAFDLILSQLKNFTTLAEGNPETDAFLSMNFVICSENSHQITQMAELARLTGARQVQFRQIQPRKVHAPLFLSAEQLVQVREQLDEAKSNFPDFAVQAPPFFGSVELEDSPPCLEGYIASYIDTDGLVFPCCLRTGIHNQHTSGNARDESFGEIWQSERYRKFRCWGRMGTNALMAQGFDCSHCPKHRYFDYICDELAPGNFADLIATGAATMPNRESAPLPDGAFDFSLELLEPPTKAEAGQTVFFDIALTNESDFPWPGISTDPKMPVGVGAHILDRSGRMIRFDNNPRPYLPAELAPGETARLRLQLNLPESQGKYRIGFDPIQENEAWFSSRGQRPVELDFTVMAPVSAG